MASSTPKPFSRPTFKPEMKPVIGSKSRNCIWCEVWRKNGVSLSDRLVPLSRCSMERSYVSDICARTSCRGEVKPYDQKYGKRKDGRLEPLNRYCVTAESVGCA